MRFSLRVLFAGLTAFAIVLGVISSLRSRPEFGDRIYNSVNGLTFSPDGTRLVARTFHARDAGVPFKFYVANVSRSVAILDTATLTVSVTIQHQYQPGNRGPAFEWPGARATFSTDGKYLDVLDWDRQSVRKWDVTSNKWTGLSSPSQEQWSSTSPDGNTEAVVVKENVELRNKQSGQLLFTQSDWRGWLVFSSDSKTFVMATRKGIEAWDLTSKKLLRRFHENKDELDGVTCVELSADNDTLAVRCHEGLRLYSLKTGDEQILLPEYFEITRTATGWGTKGRTGDSTFGIAFSRDGKQLFAWGEYGLKVFDMPQGCKVIRSDPGLWITCFTFAPDGKTYATGGSDGNVTLWDAATGKKIRSCAFQYGGADPPTCVPVK